MSDMVRCSRCDDDVQPNRTGQCPKCGCFLSENEAALTHGGRRLQTGEGSVMNEADRVALRDLVLSDLGGPESISAVMRELVEDFCRAVILRDVVWGHLAVVGPLTKAGRRRASFDLYLQASQRAERLAKCIGTDKVGAALPTVAEVLS